MTNIIEEIYKIVYNEGLQEVNDCFNKKKVNVAENKTDAIIKIFEKLIDEKIKELETKYEGSIFAEFHKHCLIGLKKELAEDKK